MFALRSSPSSLVCELRSSVLPAAEAASVNFQLSAPRPRRATVRLGFDYYNGGGSSGGGSGGRSAFSPAVSDFAEFAGVFEDGDPAQAREEMHNVVEVGRLTGGAAAGVVETRDVFEGRFAERRCGEAAAGGGVRETETVLDDGAEEEEEDDDEDGEDMDFLFEMEGLRQPTAAAAAAAASEVEALKVQDMRAGVSAASNGRTTGAAAAAYSGYAAGRGPTWGGRWEGGDQNTASPVAVGGEQSAAATDGASRVSGRGCGLGGGGGGGGGGGATLRQPRAIAPRGTRCIGSGMYRLRLSVSC